MMAIPKRQGYSTSYKKKELTREDRLGKHLHQAFKGKIAYQWSHKDKLARVEWQGPNPPARPRRKPKASQNKK